VKFHVWEFYSDFSVCSGLVQNLGGEGEEEEEEEEM
jgi:hypothetical protein